MRSHVRARRGSSNDKRLHRLGQPYFQRFQEPRCSHRISRSRGSLPLMFGSSRQRQPHRRGDKLAKWSGGVAPFYMHY